MRALPILLFACTGPDDPIDSGAIDLETYCETLTDGGTYVVAEGGGNDSSGLIYIRVLSNETADPNDPLYVAFKDFTLENVDAGGVQTTGDTSGDGLVEQLVGPGNWLFRASYTRGSTTCLAELTLPVEAGNTSYGCAVMTCP